MNVSEITHVAGAFSTFALRPLEFPELREWCRIFRSRGKSGVIVSECRGCLSFDGDVVMIKGCHDDMFMCTFNFYCYSLSLVAVCVTSRNRMCFVY